MKWPDCRTSQAATGAAQTNESASNLTGFVADHSRHVPILVSGVFVHNGFLIDVVQGLEFRGETPTLELFPRMTPNWRWGDHHHQHDHHQFHRQRQHNQGGVLFHHTTCNTNSRTRHNPSTNICIVNNKPPTSEGLDGLGTDRTIVAAGEGGRHQRWPPSTISWQILCR